MSVGPVAIGVGAAAAADGAGVWHPIRGVLCLFVAVFLQVAVNFANDYSDGIRGTDARRVGPSRLTGSGRAAPRTVLVVALVFFALAALVGLALIIRTQYWWLLIVGVAAIAAGWFYTGGKHPYGYYGLGEVFVFAFFGLVATAGTTYLLAGTVTQEAWYGGTGAGLIACAVLMVNNIRDIDADRTAGKRTLAVLIGDRPSRVVFCVLLLFPFAIAALLNIFYPAVTLVYFVLLLAIPACIITVTAKTSRELVLALQLASFSGLAYGILLGVALAF
ncbi:MAG: 1,4-dihydroxy-2-naphthoate polyprenyltransferase [Microbacteriaceae bacterium]